MKTSIGLLITALIAFLVGYQAFQKTTPSSETPQGLLENEPSSQANLSFPSGLDPLITSSDRATGAPNSAEALLAGIRRSAPSIYQRVDQKLKGQAWSQVIRKLSETNPSEAASAIANFDFTAAGLEDARDRIIINLAEQWSTQDVQATHAWFLKMKDQLRPAILDAALPYIAAGYVKQDPQKALDILGTIKDPSYQNLTRNEIAKRWMEHQPDSALQWLEKITAEGFHHDEVNKYYETMVRSYSSSHPAAAAQLIEEISDPKMRARLAAHTAFSFAAEDLEASLAWIQDLQHPLAKEAALQEVINSQESLAPHQLVRFFLEQDDQSPRSQAQLHRALGTLAAHDPDLALQELSNLPQTKIADAAESLAYGLIGSDHSEALEEWVRTESSPEIRDGMMKAIALEAVETNPTQSFESVTQIGDPTRQNETLKTIVTDASADRLLEIRGLLQPFQLTDLQFENLQNLLKDRIREELPSQ